MLEPRTLLILAPSFLLACAPESTTVPALGQPLRCETARHMEANRRIPRPQPREPRVGGVLELRDALGTFPQVFTSEHFALKSGPSFSLDGQLAQTTLDLLEQAWQREVVAYQMQPPTGSETYFLNVYVGGSGGGAPPSLEGAGAYVQLDGAGYAYVAVHPMYIDTSSITFLGPILAHEFFHTLQYATDLYSVFDDADPWFWEASAEWASEDQYPDHGNTFVGAYALLPHISVENFDNGSTGALIEFHQYGASIFLRYLSEHSGDPNIVPRAWLEGEPESTPIATLSRLLGEHSLALPATFAQFAAHTAVWDYPNRDVYRTSAKRFAFGFPDEDHRTAVDLDAAGTDWIDAPASTLPERLGFNVTRLAHPAKGRLEIGLDASATGSDGSAAAFTAVIVRDRMSGPAYVDLPMSGLTGTTTVDVEGDEDSVMLVVSAIPESAALHETFAYKLRMKPAAIEVPVVPEPMPAEDGCMFAPGGSHTHGLRWALAFLLACIVLRARMRTPRRS